MTSLTFFTCSYLLLLISWEFLPEKFWDHILNLYTCALNLVPHFKKKLPFLSSIYRGESLLLELTECEARISLGVKLTGEDCPQYKFYTELLEQIVENNRRFGVGLKKVFPQLKMALARDLQFEKKIFDESISSVLQFFIIAATTWGFVYLTRVLVSVPLSFFTVFLMIILQLSGTLSFFYFMQIFKNKRFSSFAGAFEESYLFMALLEVGLPLNDVLTRSKILQGSLLNEKKFSHLAARLKKVIERLKETGLSPKEDAAEIIGELWHLQEIEFVKFTKLVAALKFITLALFFLPAYFLFLFSIFQFFMDQ